MGRSAVVVGFVIACIGTAHAEDPNRWQGWVTPEDKNTNGVDVSMATAAGSGCRKPFIGLQPRFRNRYQEQVAGSLKIENVGTDGPATTTTTFELAIGETKVMPTTFCHDARRSLAFSIVDFRFPVRDAEAAKLAETKAAAEKAAAAEAVRRRATAEKAAAEQAAAEAELRKQAALKLERDRPMREQHERDVAAQKQGQQRSIAEQREQEAEALRYREQRAAEARATSEGTAPQSALPTERLRNGEIAFLIPVGFQSVSYGSDREGGLSYGLRGELRLFKWVKTVSEPGKPLAAAGFEFAAGGGWSKVTDLQSRGSASTVSVAGGHAKGRFWWGPLGAGVFAEWTRHARTPSPGPSESHNLYALGPEVCLGIVSGRTIALEASVRAGAVASGAGLSAGTTENVYLSASFVAEFFRFYGGAVASKYHELTSGGIPNGWNALGVFGVRLPF